MQVAPSRPLWELAAKNEAKILQAQLLENAAGVNALDDRGWTPLHIAAMCNSESAAKVLLRHCAEINAKSGHLAPTALHLAAWHGHVEIAKVLIDHGADLEATNALGEIPVEKAQQRGKRKCIELFEQTCPSYAEFRGHTCQECKCKSQHGSLGRDKFQSYWFCTRCWDSWNSPQIRDGHELPVMSYREFQQHVDAGSKWLIIDGTVVDVSALTSKGDTLHKGGGDVLTRRIGEDITGYFVYYHANIPRIGSLHKPGISHLEHVREKIIKNAVAILDSHSHKTPLTSSAHRFWVESDAKEPYHEHSMTSLAAEGVDAKTYVNNVLTGIRPGSLEARAFWSVVGCLLGDAAAQPTHWNYKISYFHADLQDRGRWETPEFLRPSMNTYYHIPMGANSCYGDQAREVLFSLAERSSLEPDALENRFVTRFSENGDYGPLPQDGLYNGSKQSVRELPIKGPWRHISLAGFIQNVKQGRHYPKSGTGDAQADCFVRIVPVVAMYAGHPDLLEKVAQAIRLTQDNPPAIAVGQAFARILESIIVASSTGSYAVSKAIAEFDLLNKQSQLSGFYGRVANTMRNCVEQSGKSLYNAVLEFGDGSYSTSQVS